MKKQYHHGNLKSALIEQAILLLEGEGLSALSLRRVARETGVSQAAPYSHFKDKRALLTAVASEGYKRFATSMRREAELNPENYTVSLGKGYVFFALDHPALFRLMFDGEIAEYLNLDAQDKEAYESYQMLIDGVAQHPRSGTFDSNLGTAVAWSLAHGLATLLLNKNITPMDYGFTEMDSFVDHVLTSSLE